MSRKGYYFTIDAIFGLMILAFSFFLLLFFTESIVPIPEYRYATDVAGYLNSISVDEFCASDSCEGMSLESMNSSHYSLMQVIGYMYSINLDSARTSAEEIIDRSGLKLSNREISVSVKGSNCEIIYLSDNEYDIDDEDFCEEGSESDTEVSYRSVVQGYFYDEDNENLVFWGDYTIEVRVW